MSLDTYNEKRDFTRTSEPPGESSRPGPTPTQAATRFVVQEHHASRLHYDFRLEIGGVLKSWAVPKGPPLETNIRRLAMQTEDHPLSYIDFSGTIPLGNYGAGTVSIWDAGTFTAASGEDLEAGHRRGKLEVVLQGERLRGKYDLIRTNEERGEWLLIKSKSSSAGYAPGLQRAIRTARGAASALPGAAPGPIPSPATVQPMLAVTLDRPFSDPAWQFEIKWDGYRALLFVDGVDGSSRLVSRNHNSFDASFPEIAGLGRWLTCESAVIDGEIVALNAEGAPAFQALQNRYMRFDKSGKRGGGRREGREVFADASIVYMAFDILYCDGIDVTGAPLAERRSLLASLIAPGGPLRFSDHVAGDGLALFEQMRARGMEGMMAKRAGSPYVQGRSNHWAKIKLHHSADVVIGGYTESPAAGRPFGSLILGAYRGRDLIPVGHVGTGFNRATMDALMREMQPLARENSPFAEPPLVNGKSHWVAPKLVCEVRYGEITADGQLRHPVFMHRRTDKAPTECTLPGISAAPGASTPIPEVPAAKVESKLPRGIPAALAHALEPGASVADASVTVSHHRIKLSNLGKVYWPETGTTKRALLRYYASVAEILLPHLADRPLVLQRYPNGVSEKSFFQHDAGRDLPEFIRTYAVEEHGGELVRYALCDDLASLLFFANLGSIPLHAWNVRLDAPDFPDRIVFDLDPGADFSSTVYVAQTVRSTLERIGLACYPKTSGSRGLHLYVPIQPIYSSDEVVGFARLVAQIVQHQIPNLVTTERQKMLRGKDQVYLDFLQNGVGKTVVAPYSVRARPRPTVSTPLAWDEVTERLRPETFTIDTIPERLLYTRDLFLPVLNQPQELGPAIAALASMTGAAESAAPPASEVPSNFKPDNQQSGDSAETLALSASAGRIKHGRRE